MLLTFSNAFRTQKNVSPVVVGCRQRPLQLSSFSSAALQIRDFVPFGMTTYGLVFWVDPPVLSWIDPFATFY